MHFQNKHQIGTHFSHINPHCSVCLSLYSQSRDNQRFSRIKMGATQKGFLSQERFVLKNTSPLQCVENGFEGLEKFFTGGIFAMWVNLAGFGGQVPHCTGGSGVGYSSSVSLIYIEKKAMRGVSAYNPVYKSFHDPSRLRCRTYTCRRLLPRHPEKSED